MCTVVYTDTCDQTPTHVHMHTEVMRPIFIHCREYWSVPLHGCEQTLHDHQWDMSEHVLGMFLPPKSYCTTQIRCTHAYLHRTCLQLLLEYVKYLDNLVGSMLVALANRWSQQAEQLCFSGFLFSIVLSLINEMWLLCRNLNSCQSIGWVAFQYCDIEANYGVSTACFFNSGVTASE